MALDVDFRGTYPEDVVKSAENTISDVSFPQLLLSGCLGVPLLCMLGSANPILWHYLFLFMDWDSFLPQDCVHCLHLTS